MNGSGFVLYTHPTMIAHRLQRLSMGILALAVLAACQTIDAQSRPATALPPTPTALPIPTASAAQALVRASIPSRIHLEEETLQALAVSPDTSTIAVGTRRGVFVYDADSFELLHTVEFDADMIGTAVVPGTR